MFKSKHIYFVFIFLMLFLWQAIFAQNSKIEMVDNFEDGDLANKWGIWVALTDKDEGGDSWGKITNFRDGYESKKGAYISYELGSRFRNKKTGKMKDPFVVPGIMFHKHYFKSHIAEYDGIHFQIKGRENLIVYLLSNQGGGFKIFFHECISEKKSWNTNTFKFSDFKGIGNSEDVDKESIIVIGFGASPFANVTKKGEFFIDNFAFVSHMEKKEKGVKKKRTRKKRTKSKEKRKHTKLTMRYFGDLKVYSTPNWKWKNSKELSWGSKGTTIYFRAIPMLVYGRIPFVAGISADPSNIKELMKGTLAELNHIGFANVETGKYRRVSLRHFRSRRFTFKADPPEMWANVLELLGMGTRVFLQVDFVKYRSNTYRILSMMPIKLKTEALPKVNTIIRNIQKNK